MELELDENAIRVVKNVFEWSDADGDGVISREDLQVASGLSSSDEVEEIFKALKGKETGQALSYNITYEEFAKGIMDLPMLLEIFKNEFLPQPLEIEIPEYNDYTPDKFVLQPDVGMEFTISGLQSSVLLLGKALKTDFKHLLSDSRYDLLEIIRTSLEKLKKLHKTQENSAIHLVNACVELYLLVRDISTYHEEVIEEFKEQLRISDNSINSLQEKCADLTEKNKTLYSTLLSTESKAIKTKEANSEIMEAKKTLEQQLEKAQFKENNFLEQLEHIKLTIKSKEQAINQLKRELRQLNSFKTIQEISGTNGRTTDDMKNRRNTMTSYKTVGSVVSVTTPKTDLASPKSDFKFQLIFNNLKAKKEQARANEAKLYELQGIADFLSEKIERIGEENKRLREELQSVSFAPKCIETQESVCLLPSLFDEILENQENIGSVFHRNTAVASIRFGGSHKYAQATPDLEDRSTQTLASRVTQKRADCCNGCPVG